MKDRYVHALLDTTATLTPLPGLPCSSDMQQDKVIGRKKWSEAQPSGSHSQSLETIVCWRQKALTCLPAGKTIQQGSLSCPRYTHQRPQHSRLEPTADPMQQLQLQLPRVSLQGRSSTYKCLLFKETINKSWVSLRYVAPPNGRLHFQMLLSCPMQLWVVPDTSL